MLRRHIAIATLVVAIISIVLTGCTFTPQDERQPRPTMQIPTEITCPVGHQPTEQRTCIPCPQYDDCYTSPDQMQHFYNVVIQMIDEYSATTYQALPTPHWYYVSSGQSGTTGCGGDSYDETIYAYCSPDNAVYIGEQTIWMFYTEMGDAGAAVGIAHEWGHHIQNISGVLANNQDLQGQAKGIQEENQADCIAGSWLGYYIAQGRVSREDLADVDRIVEYIASEEDEPGRTHGTIQERTQSLLLGLQNGIQSCNAYFPSTPVIG